MDVAHLATGETVFKEGDPGAQLYVLVEGRVEVQKLVTAKYHGKGDKGKMQFLAEYNDRSDRPWFGELALWSSRPRAASAVCTESTRLLILPQSNFRAFLEAVPTFQDVCQAAATAYKTVNKLRERQGEAVGQIVMDVRAGLLGLRGKGHRRYINVRQWERLAAGALRKHGMLSFNLVHLAQQERLSDEQAVQRLSPEQSLFGAAAAAAAASSSKLCLSQSPPAGQDSGAPDLSTSVAPQTLRR